MKDSSHLRFKAQSRKANVMLISLHADPVQASGSSEGGGTHAYIRELLRKMAFNQRYANVITRHADPSLPAYQRLSDYTSIHRIQLGEIAPIDKKELNNFHEQTIQAIDLIIENLEWDIDIFHGVYWNSGRAAMDLAASRDLPFVQTVISNGKRRKLENFNDNAAKRITIENEVYDSAAIIFCISSEEKQDLIDLYGISKDKLIVVGRPVPLTFIEPAQDENGIPSYITLGTSYE